MNPEASMRQYGKINRRRSSGYTLIEMMVSLSIFSLVITGVIVSMVTMLRRDDVLSKRMALMSDGQRLVSFLRTTTRLSRINEMVMYPQEAPHTAISYPIPEGQYDTENEIVTPDGRLVWGQTLIVHAWPPDNPTELRLTRFRPRDNSLTASEREEQLAYVALNGNGGNTLNGLNSDTRTLAKLQPEFSFLPDGGSYNFYAAESRRERNVVMGGVRLQSGENTIRFRSKGKSNSSSGYGFMLDQLKISPSGLALEGESLLPVTAQSGGSARVEENTLGNWSDRQVLSFSASAAGAEMEVTFFNDTWHETLFLGGGELIDCGTRMSKEPGDVGTRLRPSGRAPAWFGGIQAGAEGLGMSDDSGHATAYRVVIKGSEVEDGGYILADGDGFTVKFRASNQASKSLRIRHAHISEAADSANPGPAILPDTTRRLHFGTVQNRRNGTLISTGESVDTLPTDFPLDPEKSYVVSFLVHNQDPGEGNPWHFHMAESSVSTYALPGETSPTGNDLLVNSWSDEEALQLIPGVVGVESITTTYANQGVYTSRIVDTRISSANFHDLNWDGIYPENTSIGFQVRTGNTADLGDAEAWEDVAETFTQGQLGVSNGRYVQVRITLNRDRVRDEVPELRHFTLRWWGEPAYVDFGGDFQKFPEGGIVEVFVNDLPPVSTLRSELRLTAEGKGVEDAADSWKLTVETTPRN